MLKKVILAVMLATTFGSLATPASAQVSVQTAPPAPREEVVPAPINNRVWIAGHWDWKKNNYQWVAGKWVQSRRGFHYEQAVWTEKEGRWSQKRGAWRAGNQPSDGFVNPPAVVPSAPNRS